MPERSVEPWCSFCEKYQGNLIRGPGINICEECVALCNHLLSPDIPLPEPWAARVADRKRLKRLTGIGLALLDEWTAAFRGLESKQVPSCSFCRKRHHEVSKLVAGEQRRPAVGKDLGEAIDCVATAYICAGCIELCNEVVALDADRR